MKTLQVGPITAGRPRHQSYESEEKGLLNIRNQPYTKTLIDI
jgi:hypothetical protein